MHPIENIIFLKYKIPFKQELLKDSCTEIPIFYRIWKMITTQELVS